MAIKNLISATVPKADVDEIMAAVKTIGDKLPFLISLTDDQRRGGMKLGDKTIGFVDKTMTYMQQNQALVPSYLDTAEFAKDYQLTKDLTDILRILRPLVRNMEDTVTESGMEALAAAMVFYSSVKVAAKQGVQNAKVIYDDLQKRFPGAGGASATTDTPVTDTPTPA